MNKEIAKIREKIVKLEDFFEDVAKEFSKEIETEQLCFLIKNEKTGGFFTKYSTYGGRVYFSDKELRILCFNNKNEIILPKAEFKKDNHSIIKRTLLAKIQWKIRFYKIHAILPIYFNSKVICLILFRSQPAKHWPDSNCDFLKKIKPEVEYYLASILLYNQALDGVIKRCIALK